MSICADSNTRFYDSALAFNQAAYDADNSVGFAHRRINNANAQFYLDANCNRLPTIENDPSRDTRLLGLLEAYDRAFWAPGRPELDIRTSGTQPASTLMFYDEDLDTAWISDPAVSPYWEVNLQGWYDIESIVIHTAPVVLPMPLPGQPDPPLPDHALKNAVLLFSDWPLGADPLYPRANDSISRISLPADLPLSQTRVETPVQRTAQYIRIQKRPAAGQQLVITEIEIRGHYAPDTGNSSPQPQGFVPQSCPGIAPPDLAPNGLPGFDPALVDSSRNCVAELLLRDVGERLDLSYCDFSKRSLRETDFSNTILINADFSGANLEGADFTRADARQANFRSAVLSNARFQDARIERADFRNAVFGGTDFNGSSSGYACFTEIPQPFYDDGFSSPPIVRGTPVLNTSFGYARQSSTDLGRPASNAIDADVESYSLTREENSPWWQLDMGAVYKLSDIELVSTVDYPNNIDNAYLLISDWAFDTTPSENDPSVRRVDGQLVVANALQFAVDQTARYIRVKLPVDAQQRLALADINITASLEPVAPSSRQPVTDAQKTDFLHTQQLSEYAFTLETDLKSVRENLLQLDNRVNQAHRKALKVRHIKNRLETLNQRMLRSERILKLLRFIPQLKAPARTFTTVVSGARKPVDAARKAITPVENDVFAPARAQMKKLSKRLLEAADTADSTTSYIIDGENLLEDAYFCARNTEEQKGRGALEIFSEPMHPLVQAAIPVVQAVDDTVALANDTIDELLARLSLPQLEAFDLELRKLEVEFYKVYNPLRDIANVFDQNIKLSFAGIDYSFSVLEILSTDIPYMDDFLNEAMQLLDPLIRQLKDLLQIPDLPGLPAIDIWLPELNLFDFHDLNLLDYYFDFSFDPDFWDLDFLPLMQPPFPFCVDKPVIAMYPKSELDLDKDGLRNGDEVIPYCDLGLSSECKDRAAGDPFYNTDAYSPDTDRDGFSDYFEVNYGMDPNDSTDAASYVEADRDGDGMTDWEENLAGSNPLLVDTDGDGMSDAFEYRYSRIASDRNALLAGAIVTTRYLDPGRVEDALEDFDGDGLSNVMEAQLGSDPYRTDSDDDGMPDDWEVQYLLNPADPIDAAEDPDDDRLTNAEEYRQGQDPRDGDADGDGIPDGTELVAGLDPQDAADAEGDIDNDGISNLQEYRDGTLVDLSFDRDGSGGDGASGEGDSRGGNEAGAGGESGKSRLDSLLAVHPGALLLLAMVLWLRRRSPCRRLCRSARL